MGMHLDLHNLLVSHSLIAHSFISNASILKQHLTTGAVIVIPNDNVNRHSLKNMFS